MILLSSTTIRDLFWGLVLLCLPLEEGRDQKAPTGPGNYVQHEVDEQSGRVEGEREGLRRRGGWFFDETEGGLHVQRRAETHVPVRISVYGTQDPGG